MRKGDCLPPWLAVAECFMIQVGAEMKVGRRTEHGVLCLRLRTEAALAGLAPRQRRMPCALAGAHTRRLAGRSVCGADTDVERPPRSSSQQPAAAAAAADPWMDGWQRAYGPVPASRRFARRAPLH